MAMNAPDNDAAKDEQNSADGSGAPGNRLRQARERLGLSCEQVAEKLNLLVSQVNALEADRYDKLSGDTFVRGYLRSYARLVKLDGDELVYAYRTLRPRRVEPAAAMARKPPPSLDHAGGHRRYWGLVPVVALFAALWWWQGGSEPSQVVPLAIDASNDYVPLPGGMDVALVDSAESSLLDSVELLPNQPAAPAAAAVNVAAAPNAAAPGAAAQSNPVAVAAQGAAPVGAEAPLPADQLSLRFTADCWVEIKDRDNKVLIAVLKRADDQLQVQGRGPFKVLLGFAPGVEMAYNGEPVNIDVSSGNRSARLIVGNS